MPAWGPALSLALTALSLICLLARWLGRFTDSTRKKPEHRKEEKAKEEVVEEDEEDEEDELEEDEEEEENPAFWDGFSKGQELVPGGCRLIFKRSALAHCLLRTFRKSVALSEPAHSSWLSGPHVQTFYHFMLPAGQGLQLARENLQLADNGLVALDWVVGPWAPSPQVVTNAYSSPPVLLVIPNSWGRLTRNVVQLCLLALEKGYYPVIFHRRGHQGSPLLNTQLQTFGDPSDLKEAVTYIRFRQPAAPLFLVSEGSGSALLLSYLGECGSSSYATGAACISPVLRCREWFEDGLPWLYERAFLLYQKITLSRYATALDDIVDTDKLFMSRSLREFEEALFCHTKNLPISWDTYWDDNDPLRDVDEAAVPVLCICSADDPVRGPPGQTLPTKLFQNNPYFFLLLSRHGGHCGFLREHSSPAWSHEATLEYFQALTEFFRSEEKVKGLSRHRSSFLAGRRRRFTLQKREVAPTSPRLEEMFSWKRSYTK
ncbi:protein ABHD15 [Phascolarctos cinereus]|uniref:Protein ABHD15 n=1 Tax=Phascolarctos cinereus TaxID=38626 RepID=A0A6P5IJS6_PHACI|nr:protein ABHD15 [Phascolarctos cinereus]